MSDLENENQYTHPRANQPPGFAASLHFLPFHQWPEITQATVSMTSFTGTNVTAVPPAP